jgi:C4-dicarboxylate-specific signal transduction histidine kinase
VAIIDRKIKEAANLFVNAAERGIQVTPIEVFDVHDALESLVADLSAHATISLEQARPLRLRARRTEFELAVFLLLENAIEAVTATSGGRILVRVRQFSGGSAIEVHDEGAGLSVEPDQALSHFFTTKPHHLGLGLPIARFFARRLEGAVSVGMSERGGVCAQLRLFDDPM